MSSKKKLSDAPIYQLKVTLKDSGPPIWRRILVPGDISLAKLHRILQIVMGWWDSHLHQFTIRGRDYGVPRRDLAPFGPGILSEGSVKLNEVLAVKDRFVYEYDFGDGWRHEIVVEKVVPKEEHQHYPVCVAGARACPPEDCGGIWGYANFLEAIKDPNHEEHESMIEWAGSAFDPEGFDLNSINQCLRGLR